MKHITWKQIQSQKKANKRRKIIKEVLTGIVVAIVILLAMAISGQTYPY